MYSASVQLKVPKAKRSAIPSGPSSPRAMLRATNDTTTVHHATKGVAGWIREKRSRKSLSNMRVVVGRGGGRCACPAAGSLSTMGSFIAKDLARRNRNVHRLRAGAHPE